MPPRTARGAGTAAGALAARWRELAAFGLWEELVEEPYAQASVWAVELVLVASDDEAVDP